MASGDVYCIICGASVEKFCSDKCTETFRNFKSNQNLESINGFCNGCGKPHKLKKGFNNIVQHRHKECYSSSYITPSEGNARKKLKKEDKFPLFKQKQKEAKEELRQLKENSSLLLSNKKLFDEDTHLLICPKCTTYSVYYHQKHDKWMCNYCDSPIHEYNPFKNFDLTITDKDEYKIYKIYGIEALMYLTDYSWDEAQHFVANFFEDCCTTKGDSCIYNNHFEEITTVKNLAKKVKSIEKIFLDSMNEYSSLQSEIEAFLDRAKSTQYLSNDRKEHFIENSIFLKKNLESMIEGLEEFIIPIADEELSEGQKVYLKEMDEDLLAVLKEEDIEVFCWNNAKKGDVVGACFFPPELFFEFKKEFENMKEAYESISKYSKKRANTKLSLLEQQAMSLISKNDFCYQNEIWKELDIDSRKCSRVVQTLLSRELITREPATCNGARTYKLKINT